LEKIRRAEIKNAGKRRRSFVHRYFALLHCQRFNSQIQLRQLYAAGFKGLLNGK
jgi:hypothetical protein